VSFVHCQGEPRAAQTLEEVLSSAPQLLVSVPRVPQPKRSFAVELFVAQLVTHELPLHVLGSVKVPRVQTAHPVEPCRVVKKSPGSLVAPLHPVGDRDTTSASPLQTWKPGAQRSAALHPLPLGFALVLPAL